VIDVGEHLCGLYSNPGARDAMLVSYLHDGLAAGHKCVGIVEDGERPALLERIATMGDLDVGDCLDRGQLELFAVTESYLRRGTVSVEDMLDFWKVSERIATGLDGYDASFGTGDIAALADRLDESFDDLIAYESELNGLVARSAQTFLCLYDLGLLDGSALQEVLRTHPKVLLNGLALENPHYQAVDEDLTALRARAWRSLSDGERRVGELAAQGVATGDIAVRLQLPRLIVDLNLHGVYRALDLTSHGELVRFLRDRRRSE
jgi:hypothetical protein